MILLALGSVLAATVLVRGVAISRHRRTWSPSIASPGIIFAGLAWATIALKPIAVSRADLPSLDVWRYSGIEAMANASSFVVFGFATGALTFQIIEGGFQPPAAEPTERRFHPWIYRASLLLSIGLFTVFVAAYGPSALLERDSYLPTYQIPQLASFAVVLVPAAWVTGNIALFEARLSGDRVQQIVVAVFLAGQVVAAFATGSRVLALLPLISLVVARLYFRRSPWWALAGACLLALVGSGLALTNRGVSAGDGLFAYVDHFSSATPVDLGTVFRSVQNVLFSIPLLSFVGQYGQFTPADLLVSASPALGTDAGWRDIASGLRVHDFIPFNAFGEMLAMSPLVLFVYACLLPLLFGSLLIFSGRPFSSVGSLFIVLYYLTFVLSLQYNSRSSFRLMYACLAVAVLSRAFSQRRETLTGRLREI